MLRNLAVVLFRPKFSENVGSTARAMANMGCSDLVVVAPQEWDEGRARALATAKGQDILDRMTVVDDLASALAPFEAVYGTTARTGGWRKGLLSPETAALRAVEGLRAGARVAVLFGPEDKGLTNDETKVCSRLLTIPTSEEASSLNLAQAVLIILYEFRKAATAKPVRPHAPGVRDEDGSPAVHAPGEGGVTDLPCPPEQGANDGAQAADPGTNAPDGGPRSPWPGESRQTTHQEREALFANLQETLLAIDFLKEDNPDYWMLPVRGFMDRIRLKRSEFNLLMGICRQVKWAVGKGGKK